jgi:arsenate reductase (glutaredoxin)
MKLYHNPDCGTSRNLGIEPEIIAYLKTPPSRAEILSVARRAGVPLRALMRDKEAIFAELGLADASLDDEALLDAIEKHPVLLNRPIVVTDTIVKLCRPSETVLEIL